MNEAYCIHCGKKNLPEARFCLYCGKSIPRENKSEPAQTPETKNLECPYCGQMIQPQEDVTQLICLQCAAAFEIKRDGGSARLEILRFS